MAYRSIFLNPERFNEVEAILNNFSADGWRLHTALPLVPPGWQTSWMMMVFEQETA